MGYLTDGPNPEAPLAAANEAYAATPPSFGAGVEAQFQDTSAIGYVGRWLRRGVMGQGGFSGAAARGLTESAGSEGEFSPQDMGLTAQGEAQPSPMLSADEINQKYAPMGPDGKPTKIANSPMPEALAKVVADQKSAQIERDGILGRFENAHAWPVNFATGTAAFLMDPLNAASAFIPGFGEESVAAALGGGFFARTAGRLFSSAVGGAASQLPLTALRGALAREEASDYGLGDAFRDLAFAAAGNAFFHAGIGGGLRELGILKPDEVMRAAVRAPEAVRPTVVNASSQAARIVGADAQTKYDAMRTAISQVADGREVDTLPVLNMKALSRTVEEARLRETDAGLADFLNNLQVPQDAEAAADRLARVRQVETYLGKAETKEERVALARRRDELLADTTPEELQEKATALELRRQAETQRASIATRLTDLSAARTAEESGTALSPLPKVEGPPSPVEVAGRQQQLYKEGYDQALDQPTYRNLVDQIYGKQANAPKESEVPATDADKRLAMATDDLKAMEAAGVQIHPDDRAEIEAANANLAKTDDYEAASREAAACLGNAA